MLFLGSYSYRPNIDAAEFLIQNVWPMIKRELPEAKLVIAGQKPWKIAQFALGRPITAEDAPELEQVHQTEQDRGGTYVDVVSALVMSDLVQATATEPPK